MATIRRIPQMDHNFQLVITRVYEDEDQGLLAADDETDEERVFLVGEELDFRPGVTDGEPTFDHSGIVTAQIVRGGSGYDYYLSAATSDDHLLLHKIASELNQRCSKKIRTLTWNHTGDNGVGHSWLFRFENDEDYQAFISTFMSCLWETTNQTSWAKIKADEQDYVMRSANDEDVEMKDVEDSDEDEDAVQSALDPDEEPSDDEEEDEVHLERPPRRRRRAVRIRLPRHKRPNESLLRDLHVSRHV
ncbi:VID27 cytoplasmic protein-domain-containing protein [Ephemerocybe angulata]|uniref:VID27 cytoplasmic protein-domain-containing protein n=1 Tax=Ephemerocybe angulata TaxID=980116 RepID=A0A8H6HYY4_9AGAR|nr:VID27 cytoplasmic protein-domain-containing protein [Tulosesus angulatus]